MNIFRLRQMMVVPDPFLSLNCPSDESLVWLKERLAAVDLRVVQTFDLTTARQALGDCSCPHHGTEQCDCQMVVLLVYANGDEPATLILHGNDGQSWFSLVERADQQPDKETIMVIQTALHRSTELIQAVRDVHEGKSALDPAITRKLMSSLFKQSQHIKSELLTDRELDVLRLAAKGYTNKAIGVQLAISDRTVQGHLAHTFDKMQATSRTEAVMRAVSLGWISQGVDKTSEKE